MFLIKLSDGITKVLMIFGALWAFALGIFVLVDIVMRAMNMPLDGAKEIIANSIVVIVFMQLGFAVRSGSMLRADFLVVMLPDLVQRLLLVAGYLLGAAFFFFLLKSGITPALRSYANGEFDGAGAVQIPIWPTRWAILFGAGLAGINYIILSLVEVFGLRVERLDL